MYVFVSQSLQDFPWGVTKISSRGPADLFTILNYSSTYLSTFVFQIVFPILKNCSGNNST